MVFPERVVFQEGVVLGKFHCIWFLSLDFGVAISRILVSLSATRYKHLFVPCFQVSKAISLQIGTDTCLGSGHMCIAFGVPILDFGDTESWKVKITYGSMITSRLSHLSTWYLVHTHPKSSKMISQLAVSICNFPHWYCTSYPRFQFDRTWLIVSL